MSETETTSAMPQVGAPPGTPGKVEIFDTFPSSRHPTQQSPFLSTAVRDGLLHVW